MRHFSCPEGRHFLLVNLIVPERVQWVSASLWANWPGCHSAEVWVFKDHLSIAGTGKPFTPKYSISHAYALSLMLHLQASFMFLIT